MSLLFITFFFFFSGEKGETCALCDKVGPPGLPGPQGLPGPAGKKTLTTWKLTAKTKIWKCSVYYDWLFFLLLIKLLVKLMGKQQQQQKRNILIFGLILNSHWNWQELLRKQKLPTVEHLCKLWSKLWKWKIWETLALYTQAWQ